MRTFIDTVLDVTEQAYYELLKILATHHTSRELMKFIKDVGSEVEVFLKEAVYQNRRNRETFETIINGLSNYNLSSASIVSLHDLRKKYNKAKHDPSTVIQTVEAVSILRNTKLALIEMKNLNLGSGVRTQIYERSVWIASWDHLTTGDTEISIMIPFDGDGIPPSLDFFNWTSVNRLDTKRKTKLGG